MDVAVTSRKKERWLMAELLLTIIVIGLGVRLPLATNDGYDFDIGVNQGWAKSAVQLGLVKSYTEQLDNNMLPNYPPLSIMIFSGTGYVYKWLISPDYDSSLLAYRIAIKIPSILADIGAAVILFFLLKRFRGIWWGFAAGLVYVLQPAVIYTSAVWGQTDALYTLAMIGALLAGSRNQWFVMGMCTAAAMLLKIHALTVLPVVGLLAVTTNRRLMMTIAGATLVVCLVLLPFAIAGHPWMALNVYKDSVGAYPSLSVGAYNFWSALYGNASGKPDTEMFFNLMKYRTLGLILVICSVATVLYLMRRWWEARTDTSRMRSVMLFLIAALVAHAFFVFATEMHERYLFAFLALALPLIATGGPGIAIYASVSVLIFLNLLSVLPIGSVDEAFFKEFEGIGPFIGAAQFFLLIIGIVHVWNVQRKKLPPSPKPSLLGN
jgi:Gpi18-like mannosyltransferase